MFNGTNDNLEKEVYKFYFCDIFFDLALVFIYFLNYNIHAFKVRCIL